MDGTMIFADEYRRLKALVKALRLNKQHEKAVLLDNRLPYLDAPVEEGGSARVRPNSKVSIRCVGTGERYSYRIVFPGEADIARGYVSLLTPLGASLIGRTVGERFSYESPGGVMQVEVTGVDHEG
ncbi:MAG: GreA/GreB family elongation factor [Spirochaetota bacterium]